MRETPVRSTVLTFATAEEVKICRIGTIRRKDFSDMLDLNNIPSAIGHYLAGFADGEGSFMVVLRKRNDYQQDFKVSLCFNVSQKETYILSQFKKHLKCGTLRSRPDGVAYFEVNNFRSIWENIIPFFKKFRFLSSNKKLQFAKFVKIVTLISAGKHLEESGLKEIIKIRETMNRGGKSSRKHFRKESSETTR